MSKRPPAPLIFCIEVSTISDKLYHNSIIPKLHVHNYCELHTCEISMTDDNYVLEIKYEIIPVKYEKN